jgi:Na+-transporting NADH:ubiquinone oxidoreductase subunit NqrB
MQVGKGFVAGFLVLGFAIFIAGFLTGMAAIAVLHVSVDATTVGFMLFVLGLITGMLTVAITLATVHLSQLERKPELSQSDKD